MDKKKDMPCVALIYDFDGTLSPANMQEFDFLKEVGIRNRQKFWRESEEMSIAQDASSILCYMKLMLEKAHQAGVSVRREKFVEFGRSIVFYPGVTEWFLNIRELGESIGVNVKHYINSSGLYEMIEGTEIFHEFENVYACRFLYDENGVAVWPAVAVDFTAKTQFLFMINKGIERVSENRRVNEYMPDELRPVPFRHMIYFGDGATDIPCMRLVKEQGGNSIAIYKKGNESKRHVAEQLVREHRVNFACAGDYRKGSVVWKIVESILHQVRSNWDFHLLQQENLSKFRK
jgi:phosphoserine phosphatase